MLLGIMEIEKIVEKSENLLQFLIAVVCAIVAVVEILQIPYFKSKWLEFSIERIPPVIEGYIALFLIALIDLVSNLVSKIVSKFAEKRHKK